LDITIKINKNGVFERKIMPFVLLLFLALVFAFCAFYLFTGYYHLVNWYNGLNDCYYKKDSWTTNFFTNKLKDQGNVFCITGMLIAVVGGFYVKRYIDQKKRVLPEQVVITVKWIDVALAGVLLLVTTIAWLWGSSLVYPSNDEVFSAVNCAGIHPFQTMSYYMLPNNHILFNLINSIVFHSYGDKVASGRVISLVCYWGIALVSFSWLKSLLRNRWLALIAAVALCFQFPIWGFGAQARGYELLALMEWGAFISLFKYLFSGEPKWLHIYVVACGLGYFTVPSFLSFHLGICLFALLYQAFSRSLDVRFWKFQAAGMLFVFLLYLPCLCFSGRGAMVGNQFIMAYQTRAEFLASIVPMAQNYLDYLFFNLITPNHELDFLLFLLPLCLLFFRKNKFAMSIGLFYIAMWVAVILLTVKMKIFPFDRSLTGQFSISLCIIVYTVYLLLTSLSEKIKLLFIGQILFSLFLILLIANYIKNGKDNMNHYLCHFQVNVWYDLMLRDCVRAVPPGSSIAFSDESFYLRYLFTQNGYKTSKCTSGGEAYFVQSKDDPTLPDITSNYAQFKDTNGFIIYKKR